MATDHRDASQAAGRVTAVWWPLSADGKTARREGGDLETSGYLLTHGRMLTVTDLVGNGCKFCFQPAVYHTLCC